MHRESKGHAMAQSEANAEGEHLLGGCAYLLRGMLLNLSECELLSSHLESDCETTEKPWGICAAKGECGLVSVVRPGASREMFIRKDVKLL